MIIQDPLTRLFEMHFAHGQAQLGLATKLLALASADAERARHDKRLYAGGELTDAEREAAENKFARADDQVINLRDEIKKLVEQLTGVPLACIQEANL